ncbi:tetratricopeptide repeat protein [Congregibacter variabilis]|uniref:Tetratricopeptide repeat protein n=1 Tax=Congregibacter variabilis TaxID=3081200 RepID=A0ABZ0I8B6_9GAMM|nr:tetratricopeptide repeat protein [Congregibacter sp. IMCC43200]
MQDKSSCSRILLYSLLLLVVPLASTQALAAQTSALSADAQAVSLDGRPLYAAKPSEQTLEKLRAAQNAYDANPGDADAIIWLGRRIAYTGDYRRAIKVFSDGISKFPDDPRFYRHRGHRYLSVRKFDEAIDDFLRAAVLMHDLPQDIEPDGLPNALNIPLTTTQGNVWYHLGLAYYLKQDWPLALAAFRNGYRLGGNDDNLVSSGHWIYMILRRMGEDAKAAKALDEISVDMNIIENMSYHQLCLLYKGELPIEEMMDANGDNPSNSAVAYGLANYYYYNGDRVRSDELLRRIVSGSSWSSFGYIAAEADLANPAR